MVLFGLVLFGAHGVHALQLSGLAARRDVLLEGELPLPVIRG